MASSNGQTLFAAALAVAAKGLFIIGQFFADFGPTPGGIISLTSPTSPSGASAMQSELPIGSLEHELHATFASNCLPSENSVFVPDLVRSLPPPQRRRCNVYSPPAHTLAAACGS